MNNLITIHEVNELVYDTINDETKLRNITIIATVRSLKKYGNCTYMTITDGDNNIDNIDCFLYQRNGDVFDVNYKLECSGYITYASKYRKIQFTIENYKILSTSEKLKYDVVYEQICKNKIMELPKKQITNNYHNIGIISSLNAAGLKDCLNILMSNLYFGKIYIYESCVQGEKMVDDMIGCINNANNKRKCDVIMIIRGGGSKTDLDDYNNYSLAVKIKSSTIPIVCGIGHEIDKTIVDDVADESFITPTNAAESITCGCNYDSKINKLISRYNGILMNIIKSYDHHKYVLQSTKTQIKTNTMNKIQDDILKYNKIMSTIIDAINKSSWKLSNIINPISAIETKLDMMVIHYQTYTHDITDKINTYNNILQKLGNPVIMLDGKQVKTKSEFEKTKYKKITIKFIDGEILI